MADYIYLVFEPSDEGNLVMAAFKEYKDACLFADQYEVNIIKDIELYEVGEYKP